MGCGEAVVSTPGLNKRNRNKVGFIRLQTGKSKKTKMKVKQPDVVRQDLIVHNFTLYVWKL